MEKDQILKSDDINNTTELIDTSVGKVSTLSIENGKTKYKQCLEVLLDYNTNDKGQLYEEKYELTIKELNFTKKLLQERNEEVKLLKIKTNDAYNEIAMVADWDRTIHHLKNEMNDLKALIEEQNEKIDLFEKRKKKKIKKEGIMKNQLDSNKLSNNEKEEEVAALPKQNKEYEIQKCLDKQKGDDILKESSSESNNTIKMLEQEKTLLLNEKNDFDKKIQEDNIKMEKLQIYLKKSKVIISDLKEELDRYKSESAAYHLRSQIEDLECARSIAVKAKHTLESELLEMQFQFEDINQQKEKSEQIIDLLMQEKVGLQFYLDQIEEVLTDVLIKFEKSIQEKNFGGNSKGFGAEINELKLKLELQQAVSSKLKVESNRLKEIIEANKNDMALSRSKLQKEEDEIRKLKDEIKKLKEILNKNLVIFDKNVELEKLCQSLKNEIITLKEDLKVGLKRIIRLQSVIEEDIDLDSIE